MGRVFVVLVAVFALGASSASAAGTLRVGVTGPGTVTGTGGINCTRTLSTATSGTCSQSYNDVRVCEIGPLGKPICLLEPQDISLAAATGAAGFVFDSWTGDCAGQGATCALTMDDAKSATAVFKDIQDPAVSLSAPGVARGTVTLTGTASDNAAVARVDFALGGLTVSDTTAPYSASFDSAALADGTVKATATAFDTSGRAHAVSANVTLDNSAPSLSVDGTPDGAVFTPAGSQSWSFAATDKGTGVAQVRCSVVPAGSAPSFGSCSNGVSGHAVSGKGEGAYVFTVRAVDGAGNVTDVTRSFSVDATPPATTVTSGVADGAVTSDTSLGWSFVASEPASFACRVYPAALTPGAFAPCSGDGSHVASGFAPGVYTFEVRATDLAGNVEAVPVKRTFTVVPPPAGPAVQQGTTKAAASQIVVTLAFSFANSTKKQTKLTSLVVKNVPGGATVSAACPKGCAKKSLRKAGVGGTVKLTPLLGRKPLKVGTLITVVVSKPGSSSAVKVLKIQPRKSPTVKSQCQAEGASKPGSC